jgi:FG-GAP repeat
MEMLMLPIVGFALSVLASTPTNRFAAELAPPTRIEVAGKPIDTDVGHAAPFIGDIDGDGKPDLLVGQFGEGILWVYKNEGDAKSFKLAAGTKFKDGKKDGTVPTG